MPHIVLVFRRPIFFTDTVISLCAGHLVHVDIVPIDEQNPINSLVCTSYIGETFSISLTRKAAYSDSDEVGLAIATTDDEHLRVTSYLHDLAVNKIPYNYTDVISCALPKMIKKTFLEDLASDNPAKIKSLFCSQAVVLALRNGLSESNPVTQVVKGLNSRCILPEALFRQLNPICPRVSCSALRYGAVVPYSPLPPQKHHDHVETALPEQSKPRCKS